MRQSQSRDHVWERIAPTVPDSLEDVGNGQFVAKWWKPVPQNEVDAFLAQPGITVHQTPYEPKSLPQGVAVLFSLEDNGVSDYTHNDITALTSLRRSHSMLSKTGS